MKHFKSDATECPILVVSHFLINGYWKRGMRIGQKGVRGIAQFCEKGVAIRKWRRSAEKNIPLWGKRAKWARSIPIEMKCYNLCLLFPRYDCANNRCLPTGAAQSSIQRNLLYGQERGKWGITWKGNSSATECTSRMFFFTFSHSGRRYCCNAKRPLTACGWCSCLQWSKGNIMWEMIRQVIQFRRSRVS